MAKTRYVEMREGEQWRDVGRERWGVRATVAGVSKQWFAWTDTYGVDVADGEDDVLILASTVVIDTACHGDKQRR